MNILDRRSDDYVDKVESLSFLYRLDTDEFHVICLPASFRIVSRLQHNRYGAELRRSSVGYVVLVRNADSRGRLRAAARPWPPSGRFTIDRYQTLRPAGRDQ